MRTVKSLLAICVLTFIKVASAAPVATFSISTNGTYNLSPPTPSISGSITGAGTAVLDDAGIFTINDRVDEITTFFDLDTTTLYQTPTVSTRTIVFEGSWSGSVFTPTSGNVTITKCTSLAACPPLNTILYAFDSISGSLNIYGGGSIQTHGLYVPVSLSFNQTFSATPSPVPIPTAAWMFGSGLIGLAGAARRSRK